VFEDGEDEMTTMLDAWFEECVRFLGQKDAWRDDAELIGQEKGRSLSALCSLRFHYTMWKRRTGNATEFATRYDEMMQMVEMLQGDKDYPYWKCFMKFFIWLSASQWQQLWDDVDAVLIQL
jgi:hypothetical protein